MPKAKLSIEEKILDYFQTAPIDAAQVTLRFAIKALRDRAPQTKAAPKPRTRKPETTAAAPGTPVFKD